MSRPDAVLVYRGPSLADGAPVVVIITGLDGSSENPKTGRMAQAWILRADVAPLDALRNGADASICGTCPLRPARSGFAGERACYVRITGPMAIYRRLHAGGYPVLDLEDAAQLLSGHALRIGAYGDPAMVPLRVWQALTRYTSRWTAYTHAWEMPWTEPGLAAFAMASADTPAQAERAQAAGWRTFRVREASDRLRAGEITCPASDEAGHRTTCERCGLCNGAGPGKAKRSIAIIAHGAGSKAYTRAVARLTGEDA